MGNIVATPLTEQGWFLPVVIAVPLALLAIVGGAVAFCLVRRRRNDRPVEPKDHGRGSGTINVGDDSEMSSAVFDNSRQRMSIYANATALSQMIDDEAAKSANYGAAPAEAVSVYGAPPSSLAPSEYFRPPAKLTESTGYGAPPSVLGN